MNNELLKGSCAELLSKRNFRELKKELEAMHPYDVAELFVEIDNDTEAIVFRLLSKDFASEVFAYLDSDDRQRLLNALSDKEVSAILDELYIDDMIDIIEELPANVVNRILRITNPKNRHLINYYLKYKEGSAGSLMTAAFTRLRKDMSVKEAIEYIRNNGQNRESIYTLYVTDNHRLLEGVINIKDLLLSKDDDSIKDLMDDKVIAVGTDETQEAVIKYFNDYDFITLPVVDLENRLVGIITVDDVLEVASKEATEDFELMAGMSPSEEPYLKTTVFELAKHRFLWLLVLMISGMINGAILQHYEDAFLVLPILVSFMPMLTDTGGNAGSQSSTLIIRGMALNELSIKDIKKIITKEFEVAMLVGCGLFVVNFIRIYLMYNHNLLLSLTISSALLVIVVISKLCGSILPLVAKSLKMDPAIMAAPLITTIVDALGLIIYFNIAKMIMHI